MIDNRIHKKFSMVKDAALIEQLNKNVPVKVTKGADGAEAPVKPNGHWAIASMEVVDDDGDIILIDGIDCSALDAERECYIPILPQHKAKLDDGSPAEIGRVEQLVKTEINGIKTLAFYFTFALDENGEPMDELVAKYYKRYTKGYSSSFSVGMQVFDADKTQTGLIFKKTKLFEISCVTIPANANARILTREGGEEEVNPLLDAVSKVQSCVEEMAKEMKANHCNMNDYVSRSFKEANDQFSETISKCFKEAFQPISDRLDMLEALMAVEAPDQEEPKEPEVDAVKMKKELTDAINKAFTKK